jgi:SAM-dependent methyltransferase
VESAFNPILGRDTPVVPTPFERDGWRLVQCRETGFVFLPNPPAYEALSEDHAWESTYEEERARRARQDPIFSALGRITFRLRLRLLPRRNPFAALTAQHLTRRRAQGVATVVDIGCADAKFTLRVADDVARRGHAASFIGIEVSKALAAQAGRALAGRGGRAIEASAVGGVRELPANSVAAVLMSSFLEHEARPLELLEAVRGVLEPDGVVILKVPNYASWNRLLRGARWCGFRYPDHVNYFTPKSLAMLANRAGLACEQGLAMRLPTSDNMYALLRRA